MEKFFKLSQYNTTVSAEVIGGLTTFLTMAYIVVVNPLMLEAAGIPFVAGLTATCIGAAICTLAMGLIANKPIALASGMGINAIVAYTICGAMGQDWRVAMAVVFLEGIVILLLVLCGFREAIMDAIPVSLRRAIGIGIGLFIAFIGLKGGEVIIADASTYISMGDFTSPVVIVALISIILAIVFNVLKIKGGLIISILVATIIGIPLGVTTLPESWVFSLDFSAMFAPFQKTPEGTLAIAKVFLEPALLLTAFSLLMSDFFDTMGTMVAVAQQGEFIDEEGNVENTHQILLVDSAAAAVGGLMGASSITSFVESTAGAAEGARTGLSNVVVAIAFFICAFLEPLFGMIPSAATCGALTVVGFLMMSDIGEIDWEHVEFAIPAFLTIALIPFTYSITNGIGFGFIFYCVIMAVMGRAKEVKPLMWIAALAFLAMFIFA